MLDRLKQAWRIPVKLGFLVALLLVPLGLLLYQFTITSNTALDFGRKELVGLDYVEPARRLFEHLAQHRDLAALVLSGDVARAAARQAKERQVDTDFTALAALDRRLGATLGTTEPLAGITRDWQGLRDQVRLRGLDAPGVFDEHTALLARVYELIRRVGDTSNLILDPDLDSYYLMEAVVLRLPETAETLGQLRGAGAAIARRSEATVLERARLGQLAQSGRGQMQALARGFTVAAGANPKLAATVGAQARETISGVDAFFQLVERQLVESEAVRISPGNVLTAGTVASDRVFRLYDRALADLRALLGARIARLTRERNTRLLLSGLLTLAALTGTLLIARGLNRQVRAIGDALSEVGIGNLDARAKVLSADELGTTALYLNSMLDNIRGLLQSQEERDQIQGSIMKLLTEVSAVAEGDLRASAEVGPDLTGAIADSFNYMIGELRQIIEQVQATSTRVSTAAGAVQATTEHLAQGSALQAGQIHHTGTEVGQLAGAMQQVSQDALAAARVADQALAKARQGSSSVSRTIEGMGAIRGQVQETAKRIKRLGESSQEIGEIVQVIGDVADRTSILALNATIQAAAAGDAGRGFMVIAEEVERLSQRVAGSSKNIELLVRTIQSETLEAVSAMEGTTREVVGGSGIALAAGQALQEIEEVARQLAEQTQAIARVTGEHAHGTQDVARTMERISELTNGTAVSTRDAALAIRSLAALADQLRASMDRFKLPAKAA